LGWSGLKSAFTTATAGIASFAAVLLPLTIAIGGILLLLKSRNMGGSGAGILTGVAGGALAGASIGSVIPGVGTVAGGIAGALGGLVVAGTAKPTNDMFSAGYGARTLVTPNGVFALNNADDIIAGTNLFPKGSLQAGGSNSELVRKVDNLITALSNATTTITVGGGMQTVPRMQLVGVYSRNEVR
jgi:hypothetical protein